MDRRAERDGTISGFLTTAGWGSAARTALAGDASFRRYWRLTDGARRAVLMDAPTDKLDIRPFLAIDAHLRGLGSSAPEILAADPATGLALLEDLGDATLAQRLEAGDDPDRIFGLAIDWMIDLHRRGAAAIPAGLPAYDDARLLEEVGRVLLWYVPAARGTPVDEGARQHFEAIWRALLPKARTVPFFVCNADIIWLDGARPALIRLAEAWDAARMDALLLLEPVGRAFGYEGPGDFFRADDGRLQRRGDASTAPFVFTGVQILHPRLFADAPNGAFSLNILYDRAQATRRLFGLVHDGDWLHIGTPETLTAAESWFAAREALGVRTSR
jgi:hypothetical protein